MAVTPFRKRLLKNWILNPLYDIKKINERLDMIEDLINNDKVIQEVRNNLSTAPIRVKIYQLKSSYKI